ncbi:DUF6484 domain-containing protein [Yoonia sediminilitoris]|uniref:DUF6484 domain-containing protein n=1 Tax=Yoonia sediminilitoris TaxID=1286148 RepID=A0A2T6KM56_9RHOB|nr:DUF6484 domain-containing protein [Yoonia sediminilitoris]PUB17261.1 hypothetical protein C8N45_102273 [Yoonia sediminilitoris]RCW97556.1 hypothetical protein DFP92_102273 [Yoonia sediminilitoris]
MIVSDTKDGVVIGVFLGMQDGKPLVVFAGNPQPEAIVARSLVTLDASVAGCEVALLFEDGQSDRPLIIGRIIDPAPANDAPTVIRDGESVKINAQERIELRVGKASIIMEKDGHITIRGTYLVNHASAANRIRGGSVNLN